MCPPLWPPEAQCPRGALIHSNGARPVTAGPTLRFLVQKGREPSVATRGITDGRAAGLGRRTPGLWKRRGGPAVQARGGGGAAHHPRSWPLCDWGWREVGERGCPPASPPTRPPTFKYFQQQGRKVGCGRGPGRAGPPPILGGSTRCRKGGSLYCIVYPGPGRVSPRTQTWMGGAGASQFPEVGRGCPPGWGRAGG